MKKYIFAILISTAFLIQPLFSQDPGAPPDPPGNPSDNGGPVGSGAPIGEGLLLMLLFAGAYGTKKYHDHQKKSHSKDH